MIERWPFIGPIVTSGREIKRLWSEVWEGDAKLRAKVLTPPLPRQPGPLTIRRIQRVSAKRSARWHPGGVQDWNIAEWTNAMAGEAGEACNVAKKIRRYEDGIVGNREAPEELKRRLGKELADNVLYAVLAAQHQGIDLEARIVEVFNDTSEEFGFPERLP